MTVVPSALAALAMSNMLLSSGLAEILRWCQQFSERIYETAPPPSLCNAPCTYTTFRPVASS